jgi:hypothetical protein
MNDEIKIINLFVLGDSTLLTTWSNLPFCFGKGLEDASYFVNRVNILPVQNFFFKLYERIWFKIINKIIRKIFPYNAYSIDRSLLYRFLVNNNIKKAIKQNGRVDLNIFLTYSYTYKTLGVPTVLICDYTFDIYINDILKRKANLLENAFIEYEKNIIRKSDFVINIFSYYAEEMSKLFNKNILFLGQIGINDVSNFELTDQIIENKVNSKKLVFVGNQGVLDYVQAAKLLINSYKKLIQISKYAEFELHLIGMDTYNFDELPQNVFCYGYLKKDDPKERAIYYDLYKTAKVFVNTAGSYQAALEAMYFYTPIITSNMAAMVVEFGEMIDFGTYCKPLSVDNLLKCMRAILDNENYIELCYNAHNSVSDRTWSEYARSLVRITQND